MLGNHVISVHLTLCALYLCNGAFWSLLLCRTNGTNSSVHAAQVMNSANNKDRLATRGDNASTSKDQSSSAPKTLGDGNRPGSTASALQRPQPSQAAVDCAYSEAGDDAAVDIVWLMSSLRFDGRAAAKQDLKQATRLLTQLAAVDARSHPGRLEFWDAHSAQVSTPRQKIPCCLFVFLCANIALRRLLACCWSQ
jgi:hypothetical protein